MCGIAGYILKKPGKNLSRNIDVFLNSIAGRGPDDEGVCLISRGERSYKFYKTNKTVAPLSGKLPHIDDNAAMIAHDVAFIHSRYAIIDLSEGGHQPFKSADGSVIALFNGEIYNYIELREELASLGVKFRTASDTEVLVEGYRFWGEELWPKMNGFWAVVLYDSRNSSIVFSRDRIGVAPLYWRETKEGIFFASYLEGLLSSFCGDVRINNDVILGFAQTGIKDHDGTTFYSGVKCMDAATTCILPLNRHALEEAESKKYWNLPEARMSPGDISFKEAVKKYREIFFRAVELRLRADVKVAFELSGGLDSSSVVAAAAILRKSDITTYTVKIKGADEEPYARSILRKYPVDYHVLNDLEDDFINDYGEFSKIMEEPYDNPNDYSHNRMLQDMKREGVDVVVTGAGGDEVLAGYESSFWPKAYSELRRSGPLSFIQADWYEFCRRFKTLKSTRQTLRHYAVDPFKMIGRHFASSKGTGAKGAVSSALNYEKRYKELSFHEQTLYHFKVALVPYYMRSSDHFTMGIPIEHRFPFLDYRMVEFGLTMPVSYLFKNGWTKYILRRAMEPYLPKKILWRRKKMGFTFPYKRYFSANRTVFKPLLKYLDDIKFPAASFGGYDELLRTNPALLWRLISIAIWAEYNKKGRKNG